MSAQPPNRPPLGLPRGSVRALLTLMIVAVVIGQLVRGQQAAPPQNVEPLWIETLMIALAHYFTSRRFISLPPSVVQHLEQEGHLEKEANPLYLPRHSIRAIIVAAFIGLAVYLYREGLLLREEPLSVLAVVLAYFLGMMARGLFAWWTSGKQSDASRSWEDAKALIVLGLLAYTAGADLLGQPNLVPRGLRNTSLALVLFYFGSR